MTGSVLISEPFLNDPNFKRSVVLIVESGSDGTVGFVLNQKTDFNVDLVMRPLDFLSDPVYQGGPVELDTFHYIHAFGDVEGAQKVAKDIYWSGNFEQLAEGLENGKYPKEKIRFFIGYSGWGNGQLAGEIEGKSWIVGELSSATIFNQNISDNELWKQAISLAEGDDSLLSNSPEEPWLN